ncbi:LPXTG cell wall anchor domain-containing protein [Bradyrhizobium sp. USDA 4353]
MLNESTQKLADREGGDLLAVFAREWPYLAILVLALLGIAYSSYARTPITIYWMVLAPFVGAVCISTRWRGAGTRAEQLRLIQTQTLHWLAVLGAIRLMFIADVDRMMNADASALAVLTLIALGTFTAGVHIASWRVCTVGVVLALGVPAIAWLEQSTLILLLIGITLAVLMALLFSIRRRTD